MATPDAQRIGGHQALDVQVFRHFVAAALAGFIRVHRAYQPGHAAHDLNAKVAGAPGHVGAKGQVLTHLGLLQLDLDRRRQHLHHGHVFAVQNHEPRLAKDARLGRRVGRHVTVPVQVVLRDVEHGRRSGLKVGHTIELEA